MAVEVEGKDEDRYMEHDRSCGSHQQALDNK